jgi:hypothetical protein
MIAQQFAAERQVNIIETEPRFIASILAIGLAASWLVSQASGQAIPTTNVNDSARGILQRYADTWLGRKEMELSRNVVLAFFVHGPQGGEYAIELSNDPGGASTISDSMSTAISCAVLIAAR